MGQLHEDAGAVAGGLLRAAGAPVVEVDEDVDALLDDVVRGHVVEVGHEADAARVVLEPGVVETRLRLPVVHQGVLVRDVRPRGQRRGGPAKPQGHTSRLPTHAVILWTIENGAATVNGGSRMSGTPSGSAW